MTNGAQLLKLLEPVIRPDGYGIAKPPRPDALPIEARSFESLLMDAQLPLPLGEGRGEGQTEKSSDLAAPLDDRPSPQPSPEGRGGRSALESLGQMGQFENVSLRALIGKQD